MKTYLIALVALVTLFSIQSFAGEIIRIEYGKDYKNYSDSDLRRRVWELERAVYQLQQKVFELEGHPTAASWLCKTEAMGEKFTATGGSRAFAENLVMDKCKASPRSGNGFHCAEASCSQ